MNLKNKYSIYFKALNTSKEKINIIIDYILFSTFTSI